jgi:hypothetical protein
MLKKWITSGDEQHALLCDGGCDEHYHGGTGLLFDFLISQEENRRMSNPKFYSAQRPPELMNRHPGYLQKHKGCTSHSLFVKKEAKL